MANKHAREKYCSDCSEKFKIDKRSIPRMLEAFGRLVCRPCKAKITAFCHKCNIALVIEQNWYPSSARSGKRICKSCKQIGLDSSRRLEACKKYRENHREEVKKANSKWYEKTRENNPELLREKVRRYQSSPRGKAVHAANQSLRKARIKRATPSWACKKSMLEFYVEAERISRETGVPHQVDHIVPIAGEFVCGLHVETNLRVIAAVENASKKNTFTG